MAEKIFIAKESTSQEINTKLGETNDSNGTSTSGGTFAKLNKIITDVTTFLNRLTSTRAESLDRIGSNGDSGNDTLFGVLSQGTNIEPDVKEFLNSTVGTEYTQPLNKLIFKYLYGEYVEFDTNGTHSLKIPSYGVNKVRVLACGAGGGGANGGGGGGQATEEEISVVPNEVVEISIGKGGQGCSSGILDESKKQPKSGGDTSIVFKNKTITLKGGKNGGYGSDIENKGGVAGGDGGGAGGSGATIGQAVSGSKGKDGILGAGGNGVLGPSGYTFRGAGGGGGSIGTGGDANKSTSGRGNDGNRGGGGGGTFGNYSSMYLTFSAGTKGGNGGDGYCKITWILD